MAQQTPLAIVKSEPLSIVSSEPLTPMVAHEPAQPSARDAFRSGLTKFMDAVVEQVNPLPMLKQLYGDIAEHPVASTLGQPLYLSAKIMQHIGEGQKAEFDAAKAAYDKGDIKEAVRRTIAGSIPVLGPVGRQIGDEAAAGEYATAAGHATGVIGPLLAGEAAPAAVRGVSRTPVGRAIGAAGESVADALDASAAARLRRSVAPITNSKENRAMGKQMEGIAPKLLREPDLNAITRANYGEKLETRRVEAGAAIDNALATVDPKRLHPTAPIVAKLRAEIADLQAQTGDRGGVTPATRAEQVAALKKAIDELQTLGPQANYQNLATLRQAWDEGGRMTRTPKIAPDYQKSITTGQGWATAADVLRRELSTASPEVAKANASYSLYKKASDIVDAAQQTAQARPKVGRTAVAAMTGAIAGQQVGNAALGVAVGLMADAAARSGITAQIGAARLMTQLADALRADNIPQARGLAYRLAQTTGTAAQVSGSLRAAFGGMDPVPSHATAEKK